MSRSIQFRPGFTEALERAYAVQTAVLVCYIVDGDRIREVDSGKLVYEGPCPHDVLRKTALRTAIASLNEPTRAMVDSWFDFQTKLSSGVIAVNDSGNIKDFINAILMGVVGESHPMT